ncbi:MAG: hypothetical protein CMF59_05740 [Leptospiraceae bacterium]|nr:hypothetical protein [Leptospiraceae bacterium]
MKPVKTRLIGRPFRDNDPRSRAGELVVEERWKVPWTVFWQILFNSKIPPDTHRNRIHNNIGNRMRYRKLELHGEEKT